MSSRSSKTNFGTVNLLSESVEITKFIGHFRQEATESKQTVNHFTMYFVLSLLLIFCFSSSLYCILRLSIT